MSEQELTDAILRNALELQRLSAHEEAAALEIIAELEAELKQLLATVDLAAARKREVEALIKQAREAIDARYAVVAGQVDMQGIIAVVAEKTVAAIEPIIAQAAMPSAARIASLATNVLIDGAPSAAWWAKQAEDTAFRFAQQVREGVLLSETMEQITARIVGRGDEPGILDTARRNVRALVHSSVMTASNYARLETFRKNMAEGDTLRWLSTLDTRTCAQCMALDGVEWDRDGEPVNGNTILWNGGPPAHWSCRCTISLKPSLKGLRALVGDEAIDKVMNSGGRASSKGPTGPDTSMAGFLSRLSKEEQDEMLGPGRADLWRAGKITLRDLVSGTGRELTLDQIRAR